MTQLQPYVVAIFLFVTYNGIKNPCKASVPDRLSSAERAIAERKQSLHVTAEEVMGTDASEEHWSIRWIGDYHTGHIRLVDQRQLPQKYQSVDCDHIEQVLKCIRDMAIRGAPAIGAAGAFAMVLAARAAPDTLSAYVC